MYFAFAQDSNRTWVELELKARTAKGKRYSQDKLYSYLRKNYKCSETLVEYPVTWNEDDLRTSPRKYEGLDMRIKIYLKNSDRKEWIDGMIKLGEYFLPLIGNYK